MSKNNIPKLATNLRLEIANRRAKHFEERLKLAGDQLEKDKAFFERARVEMDVAVKGLNSQRKLMNALAVGVRLAFIEGYDRGKLGADFSDQLKPSEEAVMAWDCSIGCREMSAIFQGVEDDCCNEPS